MDGVAVFRWSKALGAIALTRKIDLNQSFNVAKALPVIRRGYLCVITLGIYRWVDGISNLALTGDPDRHVCNSHSSHGKTTKKASTTANVDINSIDDAKTLSKRDPIRD